MIKKSPSEEGERRGAQARSPGPLSCLASSAPFSLGAHMWPTSPPHCSHTLIYPVWSPAPRFCLTLYLTNTLMSLMKIKNFSVHPSSLYWDKASPLSPGHSQTSFQSPGHPPSSPLPLPPQTPRCAKQHWPRAPMASTSPSPPERPQFSRTVTGSF